MLSDAITFFNVHAARVMIMRSKYDRAEKPAWTGNLEVEIPSGDGSSYRKFEVELRDALSTPTSVLIALHREILSMTDGQSAKAMLAMKRAPELTQHKEPTHEPDF